MCSALCRRRQIEKESKRKENAPHATLSPPTPTLIHTHCPLPRRYLSLRHDEHAVGLLPIVGDDGPGREVKRPAHEEQLNS